MQRLLRSAPVTAAGERLNLLGLHVDSAPGHEPSIIGVEGGPYRLHCRCGLELGPEQTSYQLLAEHSRHLGATRMQSQVRG